nr:retrovirus-related Pol polyprotein from transposon TNT 1-94 [Tanacetum cinerariifolium]
INSDKLDPHCFNVESDFLKSLLNLDTFIDFSSKFDFSGELAYIKPEIPKSDFDFEEEILLIENLLYDNSFPRSPEELNAEIVDTIIESIPLSPIPVQDGEEIAVVMINKDKFDDDYQIFMFDKVFSLLSAESEDMIFDPDFLFQLLSLRTTEFRDRVEPTTRIIPQRLKLSCVGYMSSFQDLQALWMRKFIDGLGGVMPSNKKPMEMICDNEHAIAIVDDPEIFKGARHF